MPVEKSESRAHEKSHSYEEIRFDSWEEFVGVISGSTYQFWAFRGHADASWLIHSTLARY